MPQRGARCAAPRRTVIQSLEFVRSRRGRGGGGLVRARSRPRAPAAVLLRLLTQATKARQSRPPSPRLPLPRDCSEGGGGKGGRIGGLPARGEGKASAGRRLPRAVPRVVPAPTNGPHLRLRVVSVRVGVDAEDAGTPLPPTPSPTPSSFPAASLDAVQGRLVRGPRAKHTLRHSCVAGLDVRCDFVPSSRTSRRPHSQSGVRRRDGL